MGFPTSSHKCDGHVLANILQYNVYTLPILTSYHFLFGSLKWSFFLGSRGFVESSIALTLNCEQFLGQVWYPLDISDVNK